MYKYNFIIVTLWSCSYETHTDNFEKILKNNNQGSEWIWNSKDKEKYFKLIL
jgi:hypothetical protein